MTPAPPWLAFGTVWFTYFAAIGSYNTYAPLWFKELGFSTLAIGAIASLQAWTRVFAPYAWGWWGDHGRHGDHRVRLLRLACAASLLAALGLLWVRDTIGVAAVVALLFLANGGVVTLSEATLARHLVTAQGMDSTRYGRIRMWGSIGFIVAVVAAGWGLQWVGMSAFPPLVVLSFALLWLASTRLPAVGEDFSSAPRARSVWPVLREPAVAWFFAGIFFTVLAHTSLYTFFSLYLDSLGYSQGAVGMLWAVSVVVEIAFFWFQGRFFNRLSPHRWLLLAAAVSVLRFAMVAAYGALPSVLVAAQLLHAVTFAAQHAACILLINRYFPGPLRGRGQALYATLGYGMSGLIGGVAGGWLTTHHGFAAVFWAAAVAAGLGCLSTTLAESAERRAALN